MNANEKDTSSAIDFTAATTLVGDAILTANAQPIIDSTGSVQITGNAALDAGANAILPVLWGMVGGGAFGLNALRLPRWARARDAQMGRIVDWARALISGPSALGPPADEENR